MFKTQHLYTKHVGLYKSLNKQLRKRFWEEGLSRSVNPALTLNERGSPRSIAMPLIRKQFGEDFAFGRNVFAGNALVSGPPEKAKGRP